jgi:3-dehydroquinate synthetase
MTMTTLKRFTLRPKIVTSKALPKIKLGQGRSFVIYDQKLVRALPKFSRWLKGFDQSVGVKAGESLKNWSTLAPAIESWAKEVASVSARELTVIAVGGGSVGDAVGLFAHLFKRGVRLVNVPSTHLASVDSAHGGKCGANIKGTKNVLGAFHFADEVYLSRELVDAQGPAGLAEGCAELVKAAWISGAPWASQLALMMRSYKTSDLFWHFLPFAVKEKYHWVELDPLDNKGQRVRLNLGHSLAHALELKFKLSHGAAVAFGLAFAIEWSRQRKYISMQDYDRLMPQLLLTPWAERRVPKIKAAALKKALLRDKKNQGRRTLQEIFVGGLKRPALVKTVSVEAFVKEAKRQGLVV